MFEVDLPKLMKAGAHFGHQTQRWNPKMKPYLFTSRSGVHIIDLDKTLVALKRAYHFIVDVVASGKQVLFVGTKRQAQGVIVDACKQADMPYVAFRWLGGTLTNFNTIRSSLGRLQELEELFANEEDVAKRSKKELARLQKELNKLRKNLGGIVEMKKLPGALFVIDPKTERIAIREAKKENIPVVSVVDSNCDPEMVDFIIPGNDDALKSIELFSQTIVAACAEGKRRFEDRARTEVKEEIKAPEPKSEAKLAAEVTVVAERKAVAENTTSSESKE